MTHMAKNSSPLTEEPKAFFHLAIGNWHLTIRRDALHDGLWAVGVMTACAAAGWLVGFNYGRDR